MGHHLVPRQVCHVQVWWIPPLHEQPATVLLQSSAGATWGSLGWLLGSWIWWLILWPWFFHVFFLSIFTFDFWFTSLNFLHVFFLGWFLVVLAVCFRPCPLPWWEGHTWTLHRCSGKLVSSGKFGPAAKVCWRWKSLNGLILILQARRFLKNSRSSWTMQWDTVLAKSPWEGSLLTPLMWHCDYDGACTLNRQMISFLD